jgi:hypothetical protein
MLGMALEVRSPVTISFALMGDTFPAPALSPPAILLIIDEAAETAVKLQVTRS